MNRDMRRRLIMGALASLAVGGIVFAFSAPTRTDNVGRPVAVEGVTPQGGNLDLRQVTISADLAPGYTGYLTLNGVEIPADDLRFELALNSITLVPGPDSDYRQLQPGSHCAGVVYWLIGQPSTTSQNYRWCFRLH
ncbi:MAG: hypothetical protein AB1673_10720 [Actinomycetota bacterium]|jgi:hypothetical protein